MDASSEAVAIAYRLAQGGIVRPLRRNKDSVPEQRIDTGSAKQPQKY